MQYWLQHPIPQAMMQYWLQHPSPRVKMQTTLLLTNFLIMLSTMTDQRFQIPLSLLQSLLQSLLSSLEINLLTKRWMIPEPRNPIWRTMIHRKLLQPSYRELLH